MDGLLNIIDKIITENDAECKSAIEHAEKQAKEIIAKAELDAKKIAEDSQNSAEVKVKLVNEKNISGAELEYKRRILSAKGRIISETVAAAADYLCNLPDKEYFDKIRKLALNGALQGIGSITFNQCDKARMPEDFVNNLNKSLPDGKSIELSESVGKFNGGFTISYPEMLVDCTFESLLDDNADDIKDALGQILFA